MSPSDFEEYQQDVADAIDEAIAADPGCPADTRAYVRHQLTRRRQHRALMGSREYRDSQRWTPAPRPSPDVELLRLRLAVLELSTTR